MAYFSTIMIVTLSLEYFVEAVLDGLGFLLDPIVVDRHDFDRAERLAPRRWLDVHARRVDTLARQQLLDGVADHELGEGLRRARMRRALDDRGRRRDHEGAVRREDH